MDKTVVKVIVDQTLFYFDKPFDYIVPETLLDKATVGCRVVVPFSKGNTKRMGMIIEKCSTNEFQTLKPILDVLDTDPILSEKMLALAKFIKEQTFCTWYDAVKVMLPPGINYKIVAKYSLSETFANSNFENLSVELKQVAEYLKQSKTAKTAEKIYKDLGLDINSNIIERLVKEGIVIRLDLTVRNTLDASVKMIELTNLAEKTNLFKLTLKQKNVMAVLSDIGCCSVKELCYFTGVTMAVINSLAKKGIVNLFEKEVYRNPYLENNNQAKEEIVLNQAQEKVYNKLCSEFENKKSSVSLLYGVTGSGKTQVFLKLCDKVVSSGKQVIVMVPEIALTPQTLSVFHKAYGNKVAVFHSAMTQGERLDEWKRVKKGEVCVAVGTRSAIFAPFNNLGLVIMDEEQEHTYKSEMSPRYHARDLAKFRIANEGGMLLLVSATPSVESYSNALLGRYNLCSLKERFGNAHLPEVITVDMHSEKTKNGNMSCISNTLYGYIEAALSKKQQAIVLLNRRGHNTYISCPVCGYVATCDKCSISMTYHSANNRLMCHYCGHSVPYVQKCPECGNDCMKYSGVGTQRAEDELKELFPDARILRMDADSTLTKGNYNKYLTEFSEYKYDIMIGTQMVAKGLNFPKVTVVGVIGADKAGVSDDYKSYERAFSLLTQVVGRSGRGDEPGVAVIQTEQPDGRLIELASQQDYDAFYNEEILTRKFRVYPPYCDIAAICFSGVNKELTEKGAKDFLEQLKNIEKVKSGEIKLIALGPTAAAIPRVNNSYRYKIIIKYKNTSVFRSIMADMLRSFAKEKLAKHVTAYIDVNPDSIM